MEQSSATAAVDPDRLVIQHFEQGGANSQADPIMQVGGDGDDPRNATFSIKNEDHTLGNALRFIIMRK